MPSQFSQRIIKSRRALLEARKRSVPIRALIPNIVTLLGVCAGLTAIRMAIESRFELAVAAIAVAAVLDGLDGRMARMLKASSRFGAELDSLADFVSFGVAPAIVLYLWGFGELASLGWIVVLIYALAAALRLARFNVALDDPAKPAWESAFFVGVPVPAGSFLVLLPIYVHALGVPKDYMWPPLLAVYAIAIASLMVSQIRTYSGKLIGQRISREYIPAAVTAAVVLAATLATYPYLSLTLACLTYLALIPASIRRYAQLKKESADLGLTASLPHGPRNKESVAASKNQEAVK